MDALKQRLDGVEKETRRALRAIEGGIEVLREAHAEDTRGVKRRLARVEAVIDVWGTAKVPAVGRPPPKWRTTPRRDYPELATREAAPDDEEVFGPAWPLIVEWRKLKESHPNQGKGLVAGDRGAAHGGGGGAAGGARAHPAAGEAAAPGP